MYIKVNSKDEASNLSQLIKDGNWIVLYYAEWCGHCNEMKPEWDNVVKLLSDLGINNKTTKQQQPIIHVADVESKHIPELKHKPAIEGYPTIKMYNDGKEVAKYQDERVADKITTFAMNNSKSQPKQNTKQKTIVLKEVKSQNGKPMFELITLDAAESPKSIKQSEKKQENLSLLDVKNDSKTNKVISDMKKPIEQLKMDNLFNNGLLKANNKNQEDKQQYKKLFKQQSNTMKNNSQNNTVKCEDIKKAKKCKKNPNCEYNYNTFSCGTKNKNIIIKSLPVINHKKQSKPKSNKQSRKNNKTNKKTKNLFTQLVKSFTRIGEEARKDSKILKDASKKI
jgi:thiol-disulfide isomerase/thioredoxin